MNEPHEERLLAFRYFEGKLNFEEEKLLHDYISQSDENFAAFRQWENEWKEEETENCEVKGEWKALIQKIETKENREMPGKNLIKFQLKQWKFAVAAVALFALVVSGTLFFNDLIQENATNNLVKVEAPMGQKSKITLADGTLVWLNSGTTLSYPTTSKSVNFRVELDGEAYFEVAKQKKGRFIVATASYDVEVVGTKFNVSSYSDDRYVTTTLNEGRVDLTRDNEKTILMPGESATLDRETGEITKSKTGNISSEAWINNRLIFDNITLEELITRLSRQYNVKIQLQKGELGSKKFNIALINDESIAEVMKAIEKILNVEIRNEGTSYFINEKN